MKPIVKRILNVADYDIVKAAHNNASFSSNPMNLIKARNIQCILDVRANSGQYGLFLRRAGYRGHILSSEPVRHVFDRAKAPELQ